MLLRAFWFLRFRMYQIVIIIFASLIYIYILFEIVRDVKIFVIFMIRITVNIITLFISSINTIVFVFINTAC